MAELKKYLFDNFVIEDKKKSRQPVAPEPEVVPEKENRSEQITDAEFEEFAVSEPEVKTYSEEEMSEKIKAAEQDAYERGFKTAQESIDSTVASLLENINNKLMTMVADSSNLTCELQQQSFELAQAVMTKLVPTLTEENAVEIVKGFISENFNNFKKEAKLSFYIHPDIISYVQETIAKLANSYDFEGKIALHKDPTLKTADCRIEWENGGIERNTAELSGRIEEILADKA